MYITFNHMQKRVKFVFSTQYNIYIYMFTACTQKPTYMYMYTCCIHSQEVNVGRAVSNRFGLVGFGGDCADGVGLGRVVGGVDGQQFSFASNFTELSDGLTTSGRKEDGYSAIYTALQSYQLRVGSAKQFILITDEDRDVVDNSLTQESIKSALLDESIMLNVVVNEMFSGGGDLRALGIDSRGGGYIYDPSSPSMFRIMEGEGDAVKDSGHGNTHDDYTQLALETGGGAWDLSILRIGRQWLHFLSVVYTVKYACIYVLPPLYVGGSVTASFTAAFVHAKVDEIVFQLSSCLNCTCTSTGPQCVPLAPSLCDDDDGGQQCIYISRCSHMCMHFLVYCLMLL